MATGQTLTEIQDGSCMPRLSPKVPIFFFALCSLPYAVGACCFTKAFVSQWNLDFDKFSTFESAALTGMVLGNGFIQLLGIILSIGGALRGQEHTKANLCIAIGLYCLLGIADVLGNMSLFEELGMTLSLIHVMIAQMILIMLLCCLACNGCGWKRGPRNHSLYKFSLSWVAIFALYIIWMKVDATSLAAQYGIHFSAEPMELFVLLTTHGMANSMIFILLQIAAIRVSNDAFAQYGMMRSLMYVAFGFFAMSCATKNQWVQMGGSDQMVNGQTFNFILWLVMYISSFIPLVKLDKSIQRGIENDVYGQKEVLLPSGIDPEQGGA